MNVKLLEGFLGNSGTLLLFMLKLCVAGLAFLTSEMLMCID